MLSPGIESKRVLGHLRYLIKHLPGCCCPVVPRQMCGPGALKCALNHGGLAGSRRAVLPCHSALFIFISWAVYASRSWPAAPGTAACQGRKQAPAQALVAGTQLPTRSLVENKRPGCSLYGPGLGTGLTPVWLVMEVLVRGARGTLGILLPTLCWRTMGTL